MSKILANSRDLICERLFNGASIAVGGFGLSGNPMDLIDAVRESGVRNLTIVSNNLGIDGKGLGILLENNQIARVLASYVGENKLFAEQFLKGDLEVEFVPQGSLAERMRAGGAGIAGFYTKTGVGTPVAEGKEHKVFDGETYILERGIVTDFGLVHAALGDSEGNLVYRRTARNFNPLVAQCSLVTFAEVETLSGSYLEPDSIVTPGIFVQHVIQARPRVKDIEQRTVLPRGDKEKVF